MSGSESSERTCPLCGFEVQSTAEEVAHMEQAHPEEIARRLSAAGIEVADYRQGPDLPSYMTVQELSFVAMMATRFAILEYDLDDSQLVGILVRDRGMASKMHAPWIEFEVGTLKFAIWRKTLDVYRVGPDGAVEDEPIHRNDIRLQ